MNQADPPPSPEELSDEVLVRRIQKGDETAFTLLVRRYQHKIFSLVYRVVGIPEETEDVAQEVFATVYRSIENFRGESRFSTWLYRVAVNHCKNHLKYLKRRNFHRAQDLDETPERDINYAVSLSYADPEQQVVGRQIENILQQEINALEEEHRVLIVLRDIQNLSYEEIAQVTGLVPGTLKSRLHRARNALKNRMARFLT